MEIRLGYIGRIEGNENCNAEAAIDLLGENNLRVVDPTNVLKSDYRRITYKGWSYIIVSHYSAVEIYKVLPLIKNDENFTWKLKTSKCNAGTEKERIVAYNYFSSIEVAGFIFYVQYKYNSQSATIGVKWGRKWITDLNLGMKDIWVNDATNAKILAEINEWCRTFFRSIDMHKEMYTKNN